MLEIKDIEKLAKLARIDLTEDQKKSYLKEIGAILGYVDQIQSAVAKTGEERKIADLRNVARADDNLNQTASNTAAISSEFPNRKDDYLKVKKIIEQ